MQHMCCYSGNPVDLDDTNWSITQVNSNAKDSFNPEALHSASAGMPVYTNFIGQSEAFRNPMRLGGLSQVTR